jgi:predicted ATP-grasp superfamily ATP-dependent carboligase
MSAFGSKVGPHQTAKPGDPLPPVVILNLSYSGLGIARDMTGRGARVVGLSSDQNIYGNFTRACEVWLAPNASQEPEKLADFLLRAASLLGGAVVFPTSDFDVLFLDRFRSSLEPHYRLSIAASAP